MDEHADEFCFTIAMVLRRVLEIEPFDAEENEEDDNEFGEDNDETIDTDHRPGNWPAADGVGGGANSEHCFKTT